MFKKYLIAILSKLLFKFEFDDKLDIAARFKIFKRLKEDADFGQLIQSLYTRAYRSLSLSWTQASEPYIQGFYAGRLIQLSYFLDMMEASEMRLKDLEKKINKEKQFGKIEREKTDKKYFTNNLI